jgi:hypothetical protein
MDGMMHNDMMMHDDMMMHERKEQAKIYYGYYPGPLQSTPLTRNLAPRFHVNLRGSWLNYRLFLYHVDKHPTLAWNLLLLSRC